MTPRTAQSDRDDKIQTLTEEVNKINLRQQEVFAPALKGIQVDVKTLIQKDYLSKEEAARVFISKTEFDNLDEKVKGILKWGATIATLLLAGLVSLLYAILQARVLK